MKVYHVLNVFGEGELLWTTIHTTAAKARTYALAEIPSLSDEGMRDGLTAPRSKDLQAMIDAGEVTIKAAELVD